MKNKILNITQISTFIVYIINNIVLLTLNILNLNKGDYLNNLWISFIIMTLVMVLLYIVMFSISIIVFKEKQSIYTFKKSRKKLFLFVQILFFIVISCLLIQCITVLLSYLNMKIYFNTSIWMPLIILTFISLFCNVISFICAMINRYNLFNMEKH